MSRTRLLAVTLVAVWAVGEGVCAPNLKARAKLSTALPATVLRPAFKPAFAAQPAQAGALSAASALGMSLSGGVERPLAAAAAASENFDGARTGPAFEPQTQELPIQGKAEQSREARKGLVLQFMAAAAKSGLLDVDSEKATSGVIKRIRPFENSRKYWGSFVKGAPVEIEFKGEDLFGKPTVITQASTKRIKDLTKEDFKGTVPPQQLKQSVTKLRKALQAELERKRASYEENDPAVTPNTQVRVVKFKPFIELYRNDKEKIAEPAPAEKQPRQPLVVDTQGPLGRLAYVFPRAIFFDIDMYDGKIPAETLDDLGKLQKTGVYVVAFSRKPYAEVSHVIGSFNSFRFMAVTDNGARVSHVENFGVPSPIITREMTEADWSLARSAAQHATESSPLSPASVEELPAVPAKGPAAELAPVHFGLRFNAPMDPEVQRGWLESFNRYMALQKVGWKGEFRGVGKSQEFFLRKVSLEDGIKAAFQALGDKFNIYLNSGDVVVLSDDPLLQAANSAFNVAQLSGLKGATLADNILGLMLGNYREELADDLRGSASKLASFNYDKKRYIAELLSNHSGRVQRIEMFFGHVVHGANDWLFFKRQNGQTPTEQEYYDQLRKIWNEESAAPGSVTVPDGGDLSSSLGVAYNRGRGMSRSVNAIADRGEILLGTEVPNMFLINDYKPRAEAIRRRYMLRTVFDMVTLRPDPKKPGHATVVIYDFKTSATLTRQYLAKDLQALTYAYFARQRWVGKKMPTPYLSGENGYIIDDVRIEFIYSPIRQSPAINSWDLEGVRRKIISTMDRMKKAEDQARGITLPKKEKKSKKKKK